MGYGANAYTSLPIQATYKLYNNGGCRPYVPPSLPQLQAQFQVLQITLNSSDDPICDYVSFICWGR